jgi:hypothetical protein
MPAQDMKILSHRRRKQRTRKHAAMTENTDSSQYRTVFIMCAWSATIFILINSRTTKMDQSDKYKMIAEILENSYDENGWNVILVEVVERILNEYVFRNQTGIKLEK